MTRRNARLVRALVLFPTALCASGVMMAVQHDDAVTWRPVADPAPIAAASPAEVATPAPSPASVPVPVPAVAPAPVATGASVTQVRSGRASGSVTVAPLAGRLAVTAVGAALSGPGVANIGTTALAAYQRAAAVIDEADSSCRLDWSLLAAIGAVESGHGTSGHSSLDEAGVASPAIEGPVLDGRHHTRLIRDTDGGRLDHDTRYDRALGPMQILPATWLQIAIDADGDGRRDPQDINDAALAAAVYLCSGDGDLSTPAGARSAVLHYNHSAAYAGTVLGLAAGYEQDAAVPTSVTGLVTSGGVVSAVDVHPVASAAPTTRHHASHPKKSPGGHLGKSTGKNAAKHSGKHSAKHPGTAGVGHHLTHDPVPQPASPPVAPPTPAPTPTVAPKPPVTTAPPSQSPAPAAAYEDICRAAITTAYPTAGVDAAAAGLAACVTGLSGLSDEQAHAALPDLIAGLPATIAGLNP